ncbi:MAG: hypothetical protein H6703_12575 [Myxococcales bacterium]|nr:hypothetical protein [Myxococcales bacterium]
MAYKACFACELLFEVDPGLGDSTRCPQCRGVLSDYDPDVDELDARAADADLGQASTQANQAIVRTMSYKGLASAVREKIDARNAGGAPAPTPVARPVPRAAPVPRGLSPTGANRAIATPTGQNRAISAAPAPITSTRSRIPSLVRPRGLEGLGARPATAPLGSVEPTQIDTPQIPEQRAEEDTPTPAPAPVVPRPAPVAPAIARPAPVPAAAAPVAPRAVPQAIPRPGPASVEVPRPVAVPAPAQAPPLEPPGRARTKVLDAVDIDAAVADAPASATAEGTDAPDESMLEDISMQSMHEDPARFDEPADDPSMLDDISMQSVYEPIPDASEPPAAAPADEGGYVLPATVALSLDRPLPPIPGSEPAGLLPATTAPAAEPAPPAPSRPRRPRPPGRRRARPRRSRSARRPEPAAPMPSSPPRRCPSSPPPAPRPPRRSPRSRSPARWRPRPTTSSHRAPTPSPPRRSTWTPPAAAGRRR